MNKATPFALAKDYIEKLDLQYLVDAMCHESYPLPRWTKEDAEYGLQLYKNFLILLKKHLPQKLVPTKEIDEFWHNHILYTKNYTHDCEMIFGHYLHHEPALPNENTEALVADFLQTKALYFEEFGVNL